MKRSSMFFYLQQNSKVNVGESPFVTSSKGNVWIYLGLVCHRGFSCFLQSDEMASSLQSIWSSLIIQLFSFPHYIILNPVSIINHNGYIVIRSELLLRALVFILHADLHGRVLLAGLTSSLLTPQTDQWRARVLGSLSMSPWRHQMLSLNRYAL